MDLETLIARVIEQFQRKDILLGVSPFDYLLMDSTYLSKIDLQTLRILDQNIKDLELVLISQKVNDQIKSIRKSQVADIKIIGPPKLDDKVRDSLYYEKMQARKDYAIKEYSFVQKAILAEKLKNTEMFKTQ
jgi:hypothetical protein